MIKATFLLSKFLFFTKTPKTTSCHQNLVSGRVVQYSELVQVVKVSNKYPGLAVNFLVHLKSFANKIFFPLANC